ncbi:MaoC family dehydratase N-terminal domain-containing protein [Streptomyces sp. NPDC018019]|uniref:FAS1-like dehydratase domain-containing protein n=1 Tax=Streptomyces sp. NPDC018019 TaxID=3365030 RepID=UPI003790B1CE
MREGAGEPDAHRAATSGPYAVERGKIREFAAAVGTADAAHTDPVAARALGHPDILAPPTFLTVLTLRAEERLLRGLGVPADGAGTIHREQRFVHHRPVYAGDELLVTVRLKEASRRAGREAVVLESAFHAADGTPVSTVTSTLLLPDRRGNDDKS